MPLYQYFMLWKLEVGKEFYNQNELSDTLSDSDIWSWEEELIPMGYMYMREDMGIDAKYLPRIYGLTEKADRLLARNLKMKKKQEAKDDKANTTT